MRANGPLPGCRSLQRALLWAAALLILTPASPHAVSAAPAYGTTPIAFFQAAFPAIRFAVPSPVSTGSAAIAPPPVSITMEHSGDLLLDHNNPCNEGPRTAYIPFRVTNVSGAVVSGLTASISGFSAVIGLGGGQGADQYIGALAAGETRYLYWFVEYDCVIGASTGITVSVTNAGLESTTAPFSLQTAPAQSASAGGAVSSVALGAGAIAGQIIQLETVFTFGGYKNGSSFNLQPAGNAGFAAGCFQLVGSLVTSSEVNAISPGTTNRIFFTSGAQQGGNGFEVGITYYFRYNCTGVNTVANPYAMQRDAGKDPKYSGTFDDGGAEDPPPVFPPGDPPELTFDTEFTGTPSDTFGGARVVYRHVIHNTSVFDATIDSIAVDLPVGFAFDSLVSGSGLNPADAGAMPLPGATGRILWRGIPRPPNSDPPATFLVPANDSLVVLFHATAADTPGWYTATATAYAGASELPPADALLRMRPVVDLSAALTGPAAPVAGDTVELVLTLANAGPHMADTLEVALALPTGFTLVSVTGGALLTGSTLDWPTRHDLAAGASVVDTVLVRFDSLGARSASATALTTTSVDQVAANHDGTTVGLLAMSVTAPVVSATPDGLGSPSRRLAGTGYSQRFVAHSDFGRAEDFDLLIAVRAPASFLVVDSLTVDGLATAATDSVRTAIAAGDSVELRVWYSVPQGAPAQDVVDVLARSLTYPGASRDTGWAGIRRVQPQLSLLRSVSPGGNPLPGAVLTYQFSLGNPGEWEATGVVLSDSIAAPLEFELGSVSSALPGGVSAVVSYSQDGGSTWTYTPTSGACGAAGGYDACVDAIRWTFTGDFAAGAPSGAGLLEYRARVP